MAATQPKGFNPAKGLRHSQRAATQPSVFYPAKLLGASQKTRQVVESIILQCMIYLLKGFFSSYEEIFTPKHRKKVVLKSHALLQPHGLKKIRFQTLCILWNPVLNSVECFKYNFTLNHFALNFLYLIALLCLI